MVSTVLLIAVLYLLLGVVSVGLLEILTHRVSERAKAASLDTMRVTGQNPTTALFVTLLALWVFWPFAIFAALRR